MSKFENGGVYSIRITGQGFDTTANGNPQIILVGDVASKIHNYGSNEASSHHPESVDSVRISLVFASDKQREVNIKKLRFAGWTGDNFEDFDMTGNLVLARNEHREYNGKVYDNFDLILPGMHVEDKPSVRKQMTAQMNKLLRLHPATTKPAAAETAPSLSPASPAAAQQDDFGSEIPF